MAENNSLKALSNAIYQIADTQLKKIQPDVEKMREAICGSDGIRELITSINNSIQERNKQLNLKEKSKVLELKKTQRLFKFTSSVEKLLSQILDNIEEINTNTLSNSFGKGKKEKLKLDSGDKKIDELKNSISIIKQLSKIKLKDFIGAKVKIKIIKNIIKKFKKMFTTFKDKEEMEGTLSLADSSIKIMKKLSKVAIFSKLAKIGANAIEKIFLGDDKKGPGKKRGLLGVFKELYKHKKQIKKGKKAAAQVLAACSSLFLTAMLLTGIAALAIPAFLGALALKAIIWLLSGTFKMLNKAKKNAILGSLVLLIMSASVITFALGLGLMSKTVKGMKWKDFGMMMACIGAIGAVLFVLGIPVVATFIALGSVALLLAGASLIVFGIGLRKTVNAVRGMKWKDLGMMMANIGAIGAALTVLGLVSPLVGLGSAVLLTAGAALNVFADGIEKWSKIKDVKPAIENVKVAVKSIRSLMKEGFKIKGIKDLRKTGEALLSLYKGVKDWDKFDGTKASENIKTTINMLQENLKVKIDKKLVRPYNKIGRVLGRLYRRLRRWENFNSAAVVKNIRRTIKGLQDLFKVKIEKKFIRPYNKIGKVLKRLYDGLKGWAELKAAKSVENVGIAIESLNKTFLKVDIDRSAVRKMRILSRAAKRLSTIVLALKLWENYTPRNAMENIKNTIDELLGIFGLGEMQKKQVEQAVSEKGGFWSRLKDGIKNIGESVGGAIESMAAGAKESADGRRVKNKMETLADIMSSLNIVRLYLKFWEKYYPAKGIENVNNTMDSLLKQIVDAGGYESQAGGSIKRPVLAKYFRKTAKDIRSGLEALSKGYAKLNKMDPSIGPFKSTVSAINELDVSKATTMMNLFKSFAKIGIRPFDKFTKAVHEFSDSCNKLIDALNENNLSEENFISPSYNEETGSYDMGRGVSISNTDDLAQAIANAIRSIPLNVETNMSDVRLVVDGEPGRRVVLTLEN